MKAAMARSAAAPTASASPRWSGRRCGAYGRSSSPTRSRPSWPARGDAVLRALEGHVDCDVFLRGNVVTLDGERGGRARPPRPSCSELAELIEQGHEIAPGHDRRRHRRARPARVARPRSSRTSSGATARRKVAPKTVNQKRYVDSIRDNTITFGIGPAGTGKTFLAVALAAAALSRREVNRIILTRPAVEAGERLGFLPGDLMAKIDPYLRPLFDALHDMLDAEKVAQALERGQIEVAPLAFMRGRTLNDCFIILDEAQNTTPEQMKMFLTRLGFNSKMVVTGDITQIDLPQEQASGLIVVAEILEGIEGIEFIRFGGEDVVRHRLVQRIVEAYDEHAERQAPGAAPGRAPACLRSRSLEIDVLGARPALRCDGDRAAAWRSRSRRPGIDDGHVAVEFVEPERIAELNAAAPRQGRADRRPVASRSTAHEPGDGPARARRHRDLPGAHHRPARGDRPRRAAPHRHGPRDRRRRDARRSSARCWPGR